MQLQQYLENLNEALDLFQEALVNSDISDQIQSEIQTQIDCIKASLEIMDYEINQGFYNA